MKCRSCGAATGHTVLDLGASPPSNAILSQADLSRPETWLPLRIWLCETCLLVQTEDFAAPDTLFHSEYPYLSSYSRSWLDHAERFADMARTRFNVGHDSFVVEIGANDGYLLQYFQQAGIPCLGIEPTSAAAEIAKAKNLDIEVAFFGRETAQRLSSQGQLADLIVTNNVFAHVPDIDDFLAGISTILKPGGVVSIEVAHLLSLVRENQFDTVYHEHFSYWSLAAAENALSKQNLTVFDVELLLTHGGSLRILAQHANGPQKPGPSLAHVRQQEADAGLHSAAGYDLMQSRAVAAKNELLTFLLDKKKAGESVCAYGAAAKGNTLLNFAGVRPDLVSWVGDANPMKQGRFLPGSRIPIVSEAQIRQDKPNWILILPWNIKDEIISQLDYARGWNAKFVTAIPRLEIHA
ncbi:MAG: class I SAM-dependent methyltransferase [Rhodobacteraceae bacterium]|nr:class I SAM-dependent methyltransferase [Paracoccaceae bacterium]